MLYFFIDLGDCAGGGGWGWHNLCLPVRISPQPPAHHNTSSCRDSSGSRNTAPDISSGPTITACPHNFIWNLLFPKGLYSPNLSASLKFFSTLDNLKNKNQNQLWIILKHEHLSFLFWDWNEKKCIKTPLVVVWYLNIFLVLNFFFLEYLSFQKCMSYGVRPHHLSADPELKIKPACRTGLNSLRDFPA